MSDSYPLYVYSSPEEINLKTVRDKMVGSQISRLDPGTLLIERSERQLVFVYDYGSVVFVNIGEDLHSELLSQIGLISDPKKFTVESEDFADDDPGGVTMAIKADPPYDLIVTDGDLIGTKNGHDAIREIRAAGITTPIIMASANLDLVRMVQDDDSIPNKEPLRFVTKPLRSKDLLATANALLAGGDDPAPSGSTPTTKPDTPKR